MKQGIIITAMAALALAIFAVPEAQGDSGTDVDQRIFGHVTIISVDAETDNTTTVIDGIAKGQPGAAQVTGVLVFQSPSILDDPRCPEEFSIGGDLVTLNWGETYNDGSLLSGFAQDQVVCTNGIVTVADVTGVITGGTGRFEGASGTWRLVASSPTANTNTTATLAVDLD